MKEHRKGRYTTLVSECRLSEYLHKIDEQAREQLNIYIPLWSPYSSFLLEAQKKAARIIFFVLKVQRYS
ncbi:MAG: TnpV protein, partial [Clostridia bacterium]|nr:TnpV protein [Clostridia bacterium]